MQNNRDYQGFTRECKEFLFDTKDNVKYYRIFEDYLERFAYGIDASCYRYIPQLVLKPINETEVQKIITLSQQYNIPLTFRGSGTSLSGQACSDNVLVVCIHKWQTIHLTQDSIWCDCGVIGSEANLVLKPLGKKIGPDPATINNASIGGIFSNNSSGMCCGVKQNSYHTIKSIRVILNDGYILDTSDEKNIQDFLQIHKALAENLLALRQEMLEDATLCQEIVRKFKIKNTTGYSLNALIDFEEIKDILNHIFIGAEGTLGFVSRVEYFTQEDFKHKACALIFYESLAQAARAIQVLAANDTIVSAAEIMDYACLKAVRHIEGMPQDLQKVQEGNCALLIQLESNTFSILEKNIQTIKEHLDSIPTLFGLHFSFEAKEQEQWWKVRKGLLPISAATKRSGSTVITEDICFEIPHFAQGIENITKLFKQYDFDGIIFGHALSGNVHFIITPILSDKKECANFAGFMDALAQMVVSLKGSTKAEHGTGRMMAPFVELEWGEKAYAINQRIKKIFDEKNLFNPDVIICGNPNIHIQNLKPANAIEDYLNACMECGFCEKVCPSKNLTLTPRQRIAVLREIARLKEIQHKTSQEQEQLCALEAKFEEYVVETCATCSMCATMCPLSINTAKIATTHKNNHSSALSQNLSAKISQHIDKAVYTAKVGVHLAQFATKVLSRDTIKNLSLQWNKKFKTPYIPKYMPTTNSFSFFGNKKIYSQNKVLYFSSCLNRIFAPSHLARDLRPIQEVFISLCNKANIEVIFPKNLSKMCCGKAFKDYTQKNPKINPIQNLLQNLLIESQNGEIPIVCDHSACSSEILEKLREYDAYEHLKVLDMSVFVQKIILPNIKIIPLNEPIGIYAVCACKKEGYADSIKYIAQACTQAEVAEHTPTYCCGFAGNKGFINPTLNQNALESLKDYFLQKNIKRFYASSSTCEIGLSETTNLAWQHIIYLLDEVSQKTKLD
ncbi:MULTISPECIES: FAD-binding and (Fe-S)-binding domain-containing protein [Helicobacter]|uniref:FAD-binding and (Fe-S)-binding domain-containing protein n=1 Tax=Helicobacter TaxID=209 RepID=UPI00261AEE48|nr:FAD-binding and (Fe-S)-binding domain-containing protein [Helicobacter sp. UBA3407]